MSFPFLRSTLDGVSLDVVIQPRASKPGFVGEHGGRLKIRVAAPALEGKANAELVQLVADALAITRNQVEIQRGETSRKKQLLLRGCTVSRVEELLQRQL